MSNRISGRAALIAIDTKAQELRSIVSQTGTQMGNTTRHLAALTRQEAEIYQKISTLRLDALTRAETDGELGAADRRAVQLFEQHEALLENLKTEIDDLSKAIEGLEERRQMQALAFDGCVEIYDDAVSETRARLLESDAYKDQLNRAERSADVAEHAIKKTTLAETDRKTKGKPYEDDPLFSYLWARHYGTPDYIHKGMTRTLDDWVAKICGFDKARANYYMLLEIPKRMKEHAAAVIKESDADEEALEKMEQDALAQDGVVKARTDVEQAEAALLKIDQSIESTEEKHRQKIIKQAEAARGEDNFYQEAIKLLSTALRRKDLRELRNIAAVTPLPEDDLLVDELFDIEDEERDIKKQAEKEQALIEKHQRALNAIETVRRSFKAKRYDSSASEFKDWYRVEQLLNSFTSSDISKSTLWKQIQRNHRVNKRGNDYDFGGHDWSRGRGVPDLLDTIAGRSRRSGAIVIGDSWGGSSRRRTRRSRTIPRFPTSRRGGGGFKTGGGF